MIRNQSPITRKNNPQQKKKIRASLILPLIFILQFYRFVLSPLLHMLASQGMVSACRFSPSCSEYAVESLRRFGLYQGSVLTLKRFLRCRPWSSFGFDPVPEILLSKARPNQCENHNKNNHQI